MPDKKIRIRDTRKIDAVTAKAMLDTNRMHTNADSSVVNRIITYSKKHKVDPYTSLAIGMQETGLAPDGDTEANPFHILGGTWNKVEDFDPMDDAFENMKYQFKLGAKRNKGNEADIIQAFNGYGKVGKNTEGKQQMMYGIDVSKAPIDMNQNPVYGKRIIDLRDNVLKQNPEIQAMVKQIYGAEPIHATSEQIQQAMDKTGHTDPEAFQKWFNATKGKTIIPIDNE